MTIKLLLDTDIGSDIDDAVCLAYLLAQPECELLGITTVTGDTDKRAMLASVLCKLAGKHIPIFPGAHDPLIIPQQQPFVPQAEALPRWEHDTRFPQGEAVEFMRQTIRQHPHEVTMFGIGPLTNIALLFASDPEIPSLLKGLVMMCGAFRGFTSEYGPTEWNAKLDPHATTIVYRASAAIHRSIGIDITSQVNMSVAEVRKRFTPKLLRPVLDFAEVWFEQRANITFHDPLAATTIFNDQICTFQRGNVQVELDNPALLGLTRWTEDAAQGKHEIAVSVDPARFFDHYFGVFTTT